MNECVPSSSPRTSGGSQVTSVKLLRRSQTVEQPVSCSDGQLKKDSYISSPFFLTLLPNYSFLFSKLASLKYSLKNILMVSCQYLLKRLGVECEGKEDS